MDFITKLSQTAKELNMIWVIVDRQTKITHFLAILESSSAEKLADLFVHESVARQGILVSVVSDRDVR